MNLLPKLIIPASYDMESATAIEQTAKVYRAMNELINEFNKASEALEKAFLDHKEDMSKELECFKSCMSKALENHIKVVDMLISKQNLKIEAVDNKIIELQFEYDEISESLNIGGV